MRTKVQKIFDEFNTPEKLDELLRLSCLKNYLEYLCKKVDEKAKGENFSQGEIERAIRMLARQELDALAEVVFQARRNGKYDGVVDIF